jgi:hypothetical protein
VSQSKLVSCLDGILLTGVQVQDAAHHTARLALRKRLIISGMQDDMAADGWTNIVNIDCSDVCIKNQQRVSPHQPVCTYIVADCRNMHQFADGLFGSVIDKGTLVWRCCHCHLLPLPYMHFIQLRCS